MSESTKVTCRVNPGRRTITVFEQTDEGAKAVGEFSSVSGTDAEFGNGLIRMNLQESWKYPAFKDHPRNTRRAYFNPNKVARYVDSETRKPVTDSRAVIINQSSVYYYGE